MDKTHKKTHVSEEKKRKVSELAELMKTNKTVMVLSIKNLPSPQFQEIKKKLRDQGKVMVTKKSLIDFALEHSGNEGLRELEKYVDADCALMFSNNDAFLISGILASAKTPAKAKAGQIAPNDIVAEAGGTELVPGPDISALGAVGLKVKVQDGKLAIEESKVICKEGEIITDNLASIMGKLNIIPFKIGVEPLAAYSDGKVYTGIKIDQEKTISDMQEIYGKAFAFAVELPYLNSETLPFILGKALSHENALKSLIKEPSESVQTPTESAKEENSVEEKKEVQNESAQASQGEEEPKAEEKKEETQETKPEGEAS